MVCELSFNKAVYKLKKKKIHVGKENLLSWKMSLRFYRSR